MEEVGIRALKQNASAVVARAAAGETVVITDRGRPVARLVPLHQSRLERMRAEGRVTPAVGRLGDLPPPTVAGDLTAVLLAMREEDDR
jgi:prevent-host-death family protein